MKVINAVIGNDRYITKVHTESEHDFITDEPTSIGGQNKGPAPEELLAASLGTCTCITVRMYSDRKGWPLNSIEATVTIEKNVVANNTNMLLQVKLDGELSNEQRDRLLAIAAKCPIHVMLSNPIHITTTLL